MSPKHFAAIGLATLAIGGCSSRHQSARKRRADIEAVALPHVLRPAGLVVRQRDHG